MAKYKRSKNLFQLTNMNSKQKQLYSAILAAYDVAEGQFAGIPTCCINSYVEGRNWMDFMKTIPPESRKEITEKYNYVPCDKCVEKGKAVEIKSGQSLIGSVLITLLQEVLRNKNVGK